jgi:hypothetical protein
MASKPPPGRTFTNILAEPAVDLQTGQLSPWLGQFLLRLTGYVGPVASGGSATNLTLTQQIAAAAQMAGMANTPLPLPSARPLPGPALPAAAAQVVLQGGAVISDGSLGSATDGPNGVVPGNIGDIFIQRDGTLSSGCIWFKVSGAAQSLTGWVAMPGNTDAGVTATGAAQATAYAIYRYKTMFTTVAVGTGGRLPTIVAGDSRRVLNRGANPLLIYPGSGASIESLAANAPMTIPVGGGATFDVENSTLWYAS